MTQTTFEIIDDSGILTIVNTETYSTFVDEDWELQQLREHLGKEMTRGNCICWSAGQPGSFRITLGANDGSGNYFRKTRAQIDVTAETLYLVDYTDLTMAAQFDDEKLPSKHGANLKFSVPNGSYSVSLCQVSDPEAEDAEIQEFDLILEPMNGEKIRIDDILWFD